MKFGFAAITVSVLCLLATFLFAAPPWVNVLGLVAGFAGLILLGRRKKTGGGA